MLLAGASLLTSLAIFVWLILATTAFRSFILTEGKTPNLMKILITYNFSFSVSYERSAVGGLGKANSKDSKASQSCPMETF